MNESSNVNDSSFVRIRKEPFGYILFERFTREHYFVKEKSRLENFSHEDVKKFLNGYFGNNRRIDYEFTPSKKNAMELSAPIGMYLEISKKCNFSCRHCYKPKEKSKQELGLDSIKNLIDELYAMGVFEIRLCGNEPTASPYFFEVCEYVKSRNMYLGINTNAYFDDSMQEQIISLRPDFVVVSIDGTKETHDAIRMHGSYDSALSFLARLSQTNINRRINSLLSRITLSSIEHIAQLAEKNEAGVSFLPLRPVGKDTDFKDSEALDATDMFHAVKEITALRKKYTNTTLLTYFDLLSEKATYHHSMDFNKPCPSRKNGFITYNGDFFPCDFLRYLGGKYLCGNVRKDGFEKLWCQSSALRNFQCIEHEKCKKCEFYMTKCYGRKLAIINVSL